MWGPTSEAAFRCPPTGAATAVVCRRARIARACRPGPCRPHQCATAQRDGEPSWHRRRRRQRANARTILRVAAASRLLRGHHSAQRASRGAAPAMPNGRQGGQGRGEGASDLARRFDALERMVLDLRNEGGKGGGGPGASDHRRAKGGGKAASGRDGKGNGPGGAGSGAASGRLGDWRCKACEAFPCFGRTTRCYRCGAARDDGGPRHGQRTGGGGKGDHLTRDVEHRAYLGPRGANGSRPLLGGRGRQEAAAAAPRQPDPSRPPSARVPGASLAAKVEAERHARLAGQGSTQGSEFADTKDGFLPVRGGISAKRAAWGGSSSSGQATDVPRTARPNSWAELAEEDDDELLEEEVPMHCDDEQQEPGQPPAHEHAQQPPQLDERRDDDGADGDEADDVGEGAADESTLKRDWLAHCSACRLLERDGRTPHQLVVEARALRDSAEKRWRAAKTPHPLHKRLRWAESELRDAEARESARRDELEVHLAQAAKRTRELEDRLSVDAARTARKREAVERLHREGAGGHCRPSAERAAIAAATGISTEVAPVLLAAIEKLGASTNEEQEAARKELQLAAVSLSKVEEVLREGVQPPAPSGGPVQYDIGDDDFDDHRRGDNDHRLPSDARTTGTSGADRPPAAAAVPRWTKAPNNGPWRRTGCSKSAVEEARRLLARRADGATGATGHAAGDGTGDKLGAHGKAYERSGATTNDLAVAERRDREAAQEQWREFQQRQEEAKDADQLRQEEQLRLQREQRCNEELQRHQAEAQRAAEARAAEEARQREQLMATMSPEQLALAAELHAQQLAIGAKTFGTQEAAHLAGLAHQAHVQRTLQEAEGVGGQADADRLMAMSPEEFAQWNRDCQADW